MRNGRRSSRHPGRVWFLTMIDGPHVGFNLMAPLVPLIKPTAGQRVEVQGEHLDVFEVEIVDPVLQTARHVRWVRKAGNRVFFSRRIADFALGSPRLLSARGHGVHPEAT